MSIIELIVANIWVKLLDLITLNLKCEKNKITYISYTSDKLPENMNMISKRLKEEEENYEEVYLTLKYQNTWTDKLKYVLEIVKQIYHIKTSKVVIIDGNNFVISNINKKETKVLQIWHATGALKKFGKDYDRKYDIKNYDFIVTSSSTSKSIMASAFNVSKEQVLPLGYVTTDKLFDDKKLNKYKSQMYDKYPFLKNKKVVLYAPTFRGCGIYDRKHLQVNLDKVGGLLGKDYVFLYKLHPIINDELECSLDNVFNLSEEPLYKLFSIADMLVSDYSSIIYDFTILEKPIILYTPDLEEYKLERGLYVDYEKFAPGKIAYSEEELVNVIRNEEKFIEKVIDLKNKFFDYKDGRSTERVVKLIVELTK